MSGCGDCDMQGTLVEGELHCDSCPASGEGGTLGVIGPVEPSGDCAIVTDGDLILGEAYHKVGLDMDDSPVYADSRANAQLWAAAPEMLAACEEALRYLRKFPFETGSDHQYLCGQLSVAIAKAKGATHATGQ